MQLSVVVAAVQLPTIEPREPRVQRHFRTSRDHICVEKQNDDVTIALFQPAN